VPLQITNDHYSPPTFYPENGGDIHFSFDASADPDNIPEYITVSVEIYDEAGNLVIRLAQEIPTNGSPTVSASFDWPGTDAQGLPLPYGRYAPFFDAEAEGYLRILIETCSGIWILPSLPSEPPKEEDKDDDKDKAKEKDKGKEREPEKPVKPPIPPERRTEQMPEIPKPRIKGPPRAQAGPLGSQGTPGPGEGACIM